MSHATDYARSIAHAMDVIYAPVQRELYPPALREPEEAGDGEEAYRRADEMDGDVMIPDKEGDL